MNQKEPRPHCALLPQRNEPRHERHYAPHVARVDVLVLSEEVRIPALPPTARAEKLLQPSLSY